MLPMLQGKFTFAEYISNHQSLIDPAIEPLLGNNLFGLHGNEWRQMRALISAAFTSSKMKSMFKLMSDCSSTFIDSLVKKLNQGHCEFNSKDIFTRYANDTIATCAFGISVDSMENPDNDFYVLGRKAASFDTLKYLRFFMVRTFPTISKLLGIKVTQAHVEKFFYDMVRDTIAIRDEKAIYRPDMIQIMMETRNNKNDSKSLNLVLKV
ncbi:hypothetical protein G9C98_008210 [Cotesia typhae]|uniref:Cytochrome P450 n=1 Tax=Cotesia typhae TaxID=2053667 RepID=A0A8J5QZM6_9HYME|nr:hypothetical protein G9C98_008210 [Cotesia typhae]